MQLHNLYGNVDIIRMLKSQASSRKTGRDVPTSRPKIRWEDIWDLKEVDYEGD